MNDRERKQRMLAQLIRVVAGGASGWRTHSERKHSVEGGTVKELIRPNRPIGTAEVSRLLPPESRDLNRDASRTADWRSSIGGDPSRLLAAFGDCDSPSSLQDMPEQVVQYGQMLVIRPLAADGSTRAPRSAATAAGTSGISGVPGSTASYGEAQTILVMVDSVAERDRIVRLLTERRDDAEGSGQDMQEARQARPVAEYDELRIDFAAHRVSVDGQPITTLTTLEFRLLSTLVERIDCVQSRSTLLRDVWGVNANTATRTVDVHIKRLRDKIGSARRFIECVRGVGYRFTHTPVIAAPGVQPASQVTQVSQANAAAQIQ